MAARSTVVAGECDVVRRGRARPARVLGPHVADDPRRHAEDQLALGHAHSLGEDRTGADDGVAADRIAADQDRRHANEHVVGDLARVHDRAVTDGDVGADDGGLVEVDVYDGVVLHVAARADAYGGLVRANGYVEPDGGS
jgi:hypothetical protein